MEDIEVKYFNTLQAFIEASNGDHDKRAKRLYREMDSCFRTLRDGGRLNKIIPYLDKSSKQEKVWIALIY